MCRIREDGKKKKKTSDPHLEEKVHIKGRGGEKGSGSLLLSPCKCIKESAYLQVTRKEVAIEKRIQ